MQTRLADCLAQLAGDDDTLPLFHEKTKNQPEFTQYSQMFGNGLTSTDTYVFVCVEKWTKCKTQHICVEYDCVWYLEL